MLPCLQVKSLYSVVRVCNETTPKLLKGPCISRFTPYIKFPKFCRYRSITTAINDNKNHEKSTVDKEDVSFYSKLAARWWDEQGEMRALHTMNQLRVPLIRDGLINVDSISSKSRESCLPLQGLKILEVGCGGGILTEPLARIGAKMTGIDASDSMIETARLHVAQDPCIVKHITYIHGTVEDHIVENKSSYDAVVASEVLEHVNHKDYFIESCTQALKPGGSIFITTLNKSFATWFGGIFLAENVLGLLPRGTHQYNKCIEPRETQALLEKNGCTTNLIHGMRYNFITNRWHWTCYMGINYAVHAVKGRNASC